MFIKKIKKKDKEYLYLAEKLYVDGRYTTRLVRSYGRADKLTPEDRQKIYSCVRADADRVREFKLKEALDVLRFIYPDAQDNQGIQGIQDAQDDDAQTEQNTSTQEPRKGSRNFPLLRYDHLIVNQVWRSWFGIAAELDKCQGYKFQKSLYRLSDVASFLVANKMTTPQAYLKVFKLSGTYLACPLNGVRLHCLYEALSLLGRHKDQILQCVYQNVREITGLSEPTLLFFDCTNFYYETPYDSREDFIKHFQDKHVASLLAQGKSSEEIWSDLQGETYTKSLQEAVDQAEKNGLFLRMRGPSKEGRFAQPITGLSLVIDKHGIPLNFELYPGNQSEFGMLKRAVQSIKEKYQIQNAYYVADRGLNSSENLEFIQSQGFGFIVAQKVSQQNDKIRKEMLSPDGWYTVDFANDKWALPLDEDLDGASYRYKVCDFKKESSKTIINKDGSKTRRKISVNCKIIYTYSEKRKKLDDYTLQTKISKAEMAVQQGMFVTNPNGSGWRSLLETKASTASSKEAKEQYRAIGLNKDKIERVRATAGYAALVFSPPAGSSLSEIDQEVLAQQGYKHLVMIENNFRIMKSDVQLRPTRVRTNSHILGHCVLCVLALTMVKLLQFRLAQTGQYMTSDQIKAVLPQALVTMCPTGAGDQVAFINSNMLAGLAISATMGKTEPELTSQGFTPLDTILTLVGLQPLYEVEFSGSIRKRLRISPRASLITPEQQQGMQQYSDAAHEQAKKFPP